MTELVPECAIRLQRTADTIRQQTLAVLKGREDLFVPLVVHYDVEPEPPKATATGAKASAKK